MNYFQWNVRTVRLSNRDVTWVASATYTTYIWGEVLNCYCMLSETFIWHLKFLVVTVFVTRIWNIFNVYLGLNRSFNFSFLFCIKLGTLRRTSQGAVQFDACRTLPWSNKQEISNEIKCYSSRRIATSIYAELLWRTIILDYTTWSALLL